MENNLFKYSAKTSICLIIIFYSFCNPLLAYSKDTLPPMKPFKTDSPPVIDGILDDPVWQSSPKETGFKTWSPDFGLDMKEKTEVFYAYDRENLYFAFKCYDS
jgi:hypothetical protein